MRSVASFTDEPYDPDMTVEEALREGLIVVIDTGRISDPNYVPCNYEPYNPDPAYAAYRCTRKKGHKGVHANTIRWHKSIPDIQRENEEIDRQIRSDLDDHRRMREPVPVSEEIARLQDQMRRAAAHMAREAEKALRSMHPVPPLDLTSEKKVLEDEDKRLNREWSKTYGPQSRKDARQRDKHVGKVRGRQR